MKEFRKGEYLELLNKQYPNMNLNSPKKVKINLVVLVRNIANEPKREPLKLARIVKIHDSRDDTQRVVTLTYHNVKQKKDGEWTGKPVKVDRSINDLVLVDNALNESMLNPSILKGNDEIHQGKDMNNDENDKNYEDDDPQNRLDNDSREVRKLINNNNDKANNDEDDESKNETGESKDETDESEDENDESNKDEARNDVKSNQDENVQNVRRSGKNIRKDLK